MLHFVTSAAAVTINAAMGAASVDVHSILGRKYRFIFFKMHEGTAAFLINDSYYNRFNVTAVCQVISRAGKLTYLY